MEAITFRLDAIAIRLEDWLEAIAIRLEAIAIITRINAECPECAVDALFVTPLAHLSWALSVGAGEAQRGQSLEE